MRNVYLVPGYLSSDLALASNGFKVWWSLNPMALAGIGVLRLAPDGVSPGPPDGRALALIPSPQSPWDQVLKLLGRQLGSADWRVEVDGYDWRLDITSAAAAIAAIVIAECSPASPATLVGHSTGGLIALLAYQVLVGQGRAAWVRRIITIATPIQGCYCPIDTLRGSAAQITQVIGYAPYAARVNLSAPYWGIQYLANICLTWPSLYQLMPSLIGSAAAADPYRESLYIAARYPAGYLPSQRYLNDAHRVFQPLMSAAAALPPAAVLTTVVATGLSTNLRLDSPLNGGPWPALVNPLTGDGVTAAVEQTVPQALTVTVAGAHASIPLGITQSGLLADLIRDPRVPPAPTPPAVVVPVPIQANTDGPPSNDPITGLRCIGGHC
jgi:pimeloyl-ACP methyl ester carboxylesterase